MTLPFLLLALAVASAWLPSIRLGATRVPPWTGLLALSVAAGFADGTLAPVAVGAIAGLCALAAIAVRTPPGWGRCAMVALTALAALAISLHAVPGFARPVVIDHVALTPDAVPFTLVLSFDKAAAGLVLLAAFCRPAAGERRGPGARTVRHRTVAAVVAVPAAVLALGAALGLTRFEPHWPAGAVVFLVANLLFTCVAEEAFFRGLIQESLLRVAHGASRPGTRAAWRITAIVVSTALFVLSHGRFDARWGVVLTAAGLGYGLAQASTRRIEASIATHFAVNAAHFLLFAYPALAR